MDSSRHRLRRSTWLVATISSLLLVAASVAFAGTASAAAHAAPGAAKAHTAGGSTSHSATAPGHVKSHHISGGGNSAVSLARPNDFQAQADPDGTENGGVDQPGGQGGVDTTTQDGNNGSGNDTDCEDDNRGLGVPGHCKDRPGHVTPPAGEDTPPSGTDLPGNLGTDVAGPVQQPDLPTAAGAAIQVMAPGTSAANAPAADLTAAAAAPAATPGVLPNTGAGQALLGLVIAALVALAVGVGLLHQGRRPARVIG